MSLTTTQADPAADEAAGAGLATLVLAQAAVRANLTSQAVAMATAAARTFRGWYDSDQITEWAGKLATRIESIQRVQAQSTDAYLARATSSIAGTKIRPVGRVDIDSLRTGITHAGAYARAADVYRYQQSILDRSAAQIADADIQDGRALLQGVPIEPPDVIDPIEAAIQRVEAVADMDVQLADRAQSQHFLTEMPESLDIKSWRRVIHPEESAGGSCGLCIAASDRIYYIEELRPIHGKCKCTVLPIVGDKDPGGGLNSLDLKTLYSHAGGTTAGHALKRTRYKVDDHGELGPVLTFEKDSWRGPKKSATDVRPNRRAKTPEERRASIERLLASEERASAKARDLAAADPAKWGSYSSNLEARVAFLRREFASTNPL